MAPASNLTPDASGLAGWSESDLTRALREGARPDGRALSQFMPVKVTRHLTDQEIAALYLFLQSLPARPAGGR